MRLDSDQEQEDSRLEVSLMASFDAEPAGDFDPDHDGVREYAMLVLSGGGSAGAFGAGFLPGWSKAGTRPDFKVVTGVSTGSLQATFAFLGSEYDDDLTRVFQYGTDEIYRRRGLVGAVLGDSAWDSTPLKELIDRHIDEALLASCSIPVLFPPVYFEVEIDGEEYYAMHMDGGARSQAFMRGFMLDFDDALEDMNIPESKYELSLYIIRNATAGNEPHRDNVSASSLAIATEMMESVFDLSTASSLYRIYVLAKRYGVDFNLAAIPDDFDPDLDPVVFDLDRMKRLYDFAFSQAESGYQWAKTPVGIDEDEIFDVPAAD
jgi:hypothetical protein